MQKVVFGFLVIVLSTQVWAADRDVNAELAMLYPEFSSAQIAAKKAAADSPFKFLRSFIPFYYLEVATSGAGAPQVQDLVKRVDGAGWCAGDAHPENFGALLDKDGKAVFAINDFDDAGPCPLAADALRFFVASSLNDKNADLTQIIQSYLQALRGDHRAVSAVVADLLAKAERRGPVSSEAKDPVLENDLDSSSEETPLSQPELAEATDALRSAYGTRFVSVTSAVKFAKLSGGSFGLMRYRVWATIDSAPLLIEMKQEVRPGIFPLASGLIPATKKRIAKTVLLEQGSNFSPYYSYANLTSIGEVLLRPRWKGNIGINLKDYQSSERQSVLEDEAATLGRLHARSASPSFVLASEKVDPRAWETAAIDLAQRIRKAYAQTAPVVGP